MLSLFRCKILCLPSSFYCSIWNCEKKNKPEISHVGLTCLWRIQRYLETRGYIRRPLSDIKQKYIKIVAEIDTLLSIMWNIADSNLSRYVSHKSMWRYKRKICAMYHIQKNKLCRHSFVRTSLIWKPGRAGYRGSLTAVTASPQIWRWYGGFDWCTIMLALYRVSPTTKSTFLH